MNIEPTSTKQNVEYKKPTYMIEVYFKGTGKTQYVGYRINKGVCLTDKKAAYRISKEDAEGIVEDLKKLKTYNSDNIVISIV
jgi:hypothetical protein